MRPIASFSANREAWSGAAPPNCDEDVVADREPALDRMDARRVGHILVHDLDHAVGGDSRREAKRRAHDLVEGRSRLLFR
jgi:hypothetical protein